MMSMVPNSSSCKKGRDMSPPHSCKYHQVVPLLGGNSQKRRLCSQTNGDQWKPAKRRRVQLYMGVLDLPAELLVMISTHMDRHDLRAFAVTSQSVCQVLLPEYLRRRGLVMKNTHAEGLSVELRDLSAYASLGLWSTIAQIFHPPKEMSCSIPYGTKEAQSAMGFLRHFLFQPSNTHELREFRLFLHGSNPLLLTSEFIKMQRLFYTLPLTWLSFSGYSPVDCLSPSTTLRNSSLYGSHTLTSLVISSDFAFAPGSVRTTMGILNHSPIKTLTIYMVSLNPVYWSTLLGELNMAFLEDVEFEGDIPRSALIRFLIRHKGLNTIRITGHVRLDRLQPSRSQSQPILPNLLTLHAPWVICCDIVERVNDSSNLYELQVEVDHLPHHHDPSFRHLVEILRHFRKLDHLGLQLVPSSPSTIPEASLNDYGRDGYPLSALRQVRTLSCFRGRGQLLPDEIDTICDYIRLFPMLKTLHAIEQGDKPRTELLDSLHKVDPTLRIVVFSGSLQLKWTPGASEQQ